MSVHRLRPREYVPTENERLVIALCRAHREWPVEDDEFSRQLLLRTLREAMEGDLVPDLTTKKCLDRVVKILIKGAPNPLNAASLDLLRLATNDLITARLDSEEDFRVFYVWLKKEPRAVPREQPPVIKVKQL